VTRVTESQQGHGGQHRAKGVYTITATAEHQNCESKGMKIRVQECRWQPCWKTLVLIGKGAPATTAKRN